MWIVTAELDTLKIQNVASTGASPIEQMCVEYDEDEFLWFVEAVYFPVVIDTARGQKLYTRRRRMAGPFYTEDEAFAFVRGLASSLVARGLATVLMPPEPE